MATPDTRSGRNYMKTGPGMYAFAKEHKVAGWPWLLKPMGWLGRKHFKNIENSLADDETVVVAFLTKMAGLTDAENLLVASSGMHLRLVIPGLCILHIGGHSIWTLCA